MDWILPKKDKCEPVLLRLSLAGNLKKILMSLYGIERKERGYGLRVGHQSIELEKKGMGNTARQVGYLMKKVKKNKNHRTGFAVLSFSST